MLTGMRCMQGGSGAGEHARTPVKASPTSRSVTRMLALREQHWIAHAWPQSLKLPRLALITESLSDVSGLTSCGVQTQTPRSGST